jgi:hypothetical protein
MTMKYIISKDDIPMVFSDLQSHDAVAKAMSLKVVGAGFCFIGDAGLFECYGASISLEVVSRGAADSLIINKRFGLVR